MWHRFLAAVIQHAICLCFRSRFSLSDIAEMPGDQSVDVLCETIRTVTAKSYQTIATNVLRQGLSLSLRWHRDDLVSTRPGERMCIRRAVDDGTKARASCVRARNSSGRGRRHDGWTSVKSPSRPQVST